MNANNFILLFTILLFGTCTAKSNSLVGVQQKRTKELKAIHASDNPSSEQRLLQMLDRKDFFRLETLLQEKRSELPRYIVLYIEANLQNAFNQTEQSLQTIDKLLRNYSKSLNDALLHRVFVIKYDNLFNQYHYKKAAEALKIAIDKYGHAVDSVGVAMLREENYDFVKSLKEFPVQKMHITTDVSIPVSLNQYNHIIINVSSGEQSENFIFDTGASNVVSESSARRLGIRILNSEASTVGAVDKKVQLKVGLADKLWIGDLLFENVAFAVMPDELLSFPEANYVIHGIIGFPIMNQMKEIEICKNKSITVVAHPRKGNSRNLFLDNTMPIIQFEANRDTVLFIMDTGANTTKFSANYFAAHNVEIKEKVTSNTIRRGGIGGFVDNKVYELKNVPLKIGGQEMTVPTIVVLTDKLSYLTNYDGHLGQDVLMHFNKLTLNFKEMSLSFDD
nr:aspartyl protease family protein [uncultured Bacteroides sp.]